MLCAIADLIVEVPAEGGLDSRCRDYLYSGEGLADIVIDPAAYRPQLYRAGMSPEMLAYMESGSQFHRGLLRHNGIYLHASAVALDGQAYLFSADSGVGKSTHTRLWQAEFGEKARIINDDKPALRQLDGVWYAYGTPWCGKDGINQNEKARLAGICFLSRGTRNQIRKLSPQEALRLAMCQTVYKFWSVEELDAMLLQLERLLTQVPVYALTCLPNQEAARLSYETMAPQEKENSL